MQNKLQCPKDKHELYFRDEALVNKKDSSIRYPIIDSIPILINEQNSIFSINDFIAHKDTTFKLSNKSMYLRFLEILIPKIGMNFHTKENYSEIAKLLPKKSKILVLGGSIKGEGMDSIYNHESFEIIGSDVSFGPYTKIICDAHDIPFKDKTFDCVIIQAVLEHVLDPYRCVDEIYRVLKLTGLVYAETPFMQQVHMRQFDFTRFTHLGHRRLFRNFKELRSGPCGGPGMALAWSWTYFLRSFSSKKYIRIPLRLFAIITSFFLKYFDYYLIDKPGSFDAASGFFFLGKKSKLILSDRDLIKTFRGN